MRAPARRVTDLSRLSRPASGAGVGGWGLLLALSACAPPPKAPPTSAVAATKIDAPEGAVLAAACTPTGPELCFNAVDDNCNGVIDEGCGVGTGVLQFTIAWAESAADVDLVVTDPSGARPTRDHPVTSSGLRLDRDCPRPKETETCGGQNTENVYFEGLEPPRGRYKVDVRLEEPYGARLPLSVQLSARIGAHTYTWELALKEKDDHKTFEFTL